MKDTNNNAATATAWPKERRIEAHDPDEGELIPLSRRWEFGCRLLRSKYTIAQADKRCREIHGHTFDKRFVSGRYICYVVMP